MSGNMDFAGADYSWWDRQIAVRSIETAPENAAHTLVSVECDQDAVEDTLADFAAAAPIAFFTGLRLLEPLDQVALLSYYLLRRHQASVATLVSSTQTIVSWRVRVLVRALTGYVLWGGEPSNEVVASILQRHNLDEFHWSCSVHELVEAYRKHRDFAVIAAKYNVHRPDIRKAIRKAARKLSGIDSDNCMGSALSRDAGMLGAYLVLLMDRSNNEGRGKKDRAEDFEDLRRADPEIVGQFRVRLDDPNFGQLFISKANI